MENVYQIKSFLGLKSLVEAYILMTWGKRCDDYEKDCPQCRAWKAFDFLFDEDIALYE